VKSTIRSIHSDDAGRANVEVDEEGDANVDSIEEGDQRAFDGRRW
jgi:hypothetical protein